MAQQIQKQGCTDKLATNYDPTATVQCAGCCEYKVVKKYGCTDRLAYNYDPTATAPCLDCCSYEEPEKPIIINTEYVPKPQEFAAFTPNYGNNTYPYNINPDDAVCIYETIYETEGWLKYTGPSGIGFGDTVNLGDGYDSYKESLSIKWPGPEVPNWDSNGSMSLIWAAFDTLLVYKPFNRVFINKQDLVPWIIPLYKDTSDAQLTVNPNENKFKTDCLSLNGGIPYVYNQGSDVKSHFMACLCGNNDTPPEPDTCETKVFNPEGTVNYKPITKRDATCLKGRKGFDNYIKLLTNQYELGWRGRQDTFFNEVVLTELGIQYNDVKFIIENVFNTDYAIYPYGSTTQLNITGQKKAKELLSQAFENGGNLWLPLSSSLSTDIIHKKECCDIVGGVYKEGTSKEEIWAQLSNLVGGYAFGDNIPATPTGEFRDVTRGVCLCNEIKPPCPTLASGLALFTEVIETREGTEYITTVDVSEECCSNASLESRMKGVWTWDGTRCVLVNNESSNGCDTTTTLTINETPINLKDVNCEGNSITVSAYIYFEEPDNRCTDGVLNNSTLDPVTDELINFYENPPETLSEISNFSPQYFELEDYGSTGNDTTPQPQSTKCCYDTSTPIEGILIIQDLNKTKIETGVVYVDTFTTTQTNINTNVGVGQGFNKWVRLTTTVDLTQLTSNEFNIGVEFTQGLFKCCDYNIFFDDLDVGCLQTGIRETYYTEPCVGFDLSTCVIDNKKSWVYNPGKLEMSDTIYDNMVRRNGTLGMNIEPSGIISAGGHGPINRVFAPSVDAELDFRDTDYYNFHGVIERHSKLVLNSKQLIVQFNMCPDNDCVLGTYGYLTDDDGSYILDDDGGRIIIQDEIVPFPNLVDLEKFKKTFQGFWTQIIEQFIPATTIFVSGEKWCNNRICEEKVVADYLLDARGNNDDLSPQPATTTPQTIQSQPRIQTQQPQALVTLGSPGNTLTSGQKANTNDSPIGPIVVGNTKLYGLDNLDPDLSTKTLVKPLSP
jgi:hypothetical protein